MASAESAAGIAGSQTRGSVLRRCVEFVGERFGAEARGELLRASVQRDVGLPLGSLAVEAWYPTPAAMELLAFITRSFFDGCHERHAEIGAYALERDLGGIYRAFLRVPGTQFLLRGAPMIWKAYNSSGELRVLEQSAEHAILSFEGHSHPTPDLWNLVSGASHGTLELAGAKQLRRRATAGFDGDPRRLVLCFDWE